MRTSILLLFIFLVHLTIAGQTERRVISGKVTSDSLAVESIHIINKTSRKATISDRNGIFQIPVRVNDILLISSVEFKNQEIKVNELNINTLKIIIKLEKEITSLDEVIVRKPKNIATELGLPNAGKKPLTKLESRLNYHTKASVPIAILTTLIGKAGGLEDLYYIFSGNRKKDRKLSKLLEQDKLDAFQQQQLENIRVRLTDAFFVETLKIPKEEIDTFITYCDAQDIFYLLSKDKTLEVIDIFVKESQGYLEQQQNKE